MASAVGRLPEVSDVSFGIRHIGGGYDRAEVDAFLHELSEAVSDVRAAMDSGRRELTNLRAENARLRAAPAPTSSRRSPPEPSGCFRRRS